MRLQSSGQSFIFGSILANPFLSGVSQSVDLCSLDRLLTEQLKAFRCFRLARPKEGRNADDTAIGKAVIESRQPK